jgi:hypothetical protein
MGEILDLGMKFGAIKKGGAWFSIVDSFDFAAAGMSKPTTPLLLGQGREKSKTALAEQPLLVAAIEALIRYAYYVAIRTVYQHFSGESIGCAAVV